MRQQTSTSSILLPSYCCHWWVPWWHTTDRRSKQAGAKDSNRRGCEARSRQGIDYWWFPGFELIKWPNSTAACNWCCLSKAAGSMDDETESLADHVYYLLLVSKEPTSWKASNIMQSMKAGNSAPVSQVQAARTHTHFFVSHTWGKAYDSLSLSLSFLSLGPRRKLLLSPRSLATAATANQIDS